VARLPDVNVLLPALRSDDVQHNALRAWLKSALESDEPLAVCPNILCSVVRLSTHPRIYARPTALSTALDFADYLLEHPRVEIVRPGVSHWRIFRQLCEESGATGKLVPDAANAALAIEHGCIFVTQDRDYGRFAGLRWCSPLEDLGPGGYYLMESRGAYRVPVRHTRRAREASAG